MIATMIVYRTVQMMLIIDCKRGDIMVIFGTKVEFDGKRYILLDSEKRDEYRIGEMICELSRLDIYSFKSLLLKVPNFDDIVDESLSLDNLKWLRNEMSKSYSPLICEMVFYEFYNCSTEYFDCEKKTQKDDDWQWEWSDSIDQLCNTNGIGNNVFSNTGYEGVGTETLGQFLLSIYVEVAFDFLWIMDQFDHFLNGGVKESRQKNKYKIVRMSKRDSYLQHIDYSIAYENGGLHSIYKIKTMWSLGLFEMAHIYEQGVPIIRCKNCGQYFVPRNRSDTKYCNYPAPDGEGKTCKEIGAQKAWAAKEKTDDVTREYRRVYMRYKMTVNRHPDNKEVQERLEQLTEGIKQWRQKLASGEAEKDDFMRWLEQF